MFLDLQYIKEQVFALTIHKFVGLWTYNTKICMFLDKVGLTIHKVAGLWTYNTESSSSLDLQYIK